MTRAERNMAFIEEFCKVPDGDKVGQKVQLIDFQEALFYAIYDNKVPTREVILSIGRKNAKTATIAFLLLLHTVGPEARQNSEIVSGAMSREQAAQVFRYACKVLRQDQRISGRARTVDSSKIIVGLNQNVTYKAMAADAGTAMGGSPILTLIDEAGQIKGSSSEFVDAITTGQGAHSEPMTIIISTQAPTDGDYLSIRIDDAAIAQDPSIVCHVYETPETFGLLDEEGWKYSNPALGVFRSVKDMREQMTKAARMPSEENGKRNLLLNQRVEKTAPFVSPDLWKSNGGAASIPLAAKVWLGLDLSQVKDLTALVMVAEIDGIWHVEPTFWLPGAAIHDRTKEDRVPYDKWRDAGYLQSAPGETVDYDFVAAHIAQIFADYDVQGAGFDRWKMEVLKPKLVEAGLTEDQMELFQDFGQGFKSMSPALNVLEADLLNKRIAHGNHPVLAYCARNAVVQEDAAQNRKLIKLARHRRIDGMIALTMARGIASTGAPPDGPSVYEERGILIV
jgi:phage terminase large subunit-like protein